jgi:DNA-binding beta-propeller fold protein YncE
MMTVAGIVPGPVSPFSTYVLRARAAFRLISPQRLFLVLAMLGGPALKMHAQSTAVSTLTLPKGANDIVWDGTRSRFFASSATNVVMINPETATIEDTIPITNVAGQIAVSDDGQFLYVALETAFASSSLGMISRYSIQSHSLDLQIPLGTYGEGAERGVQAIVVLAGQPSSVLVATSDHQVTVFDNAVARSQVAPLGLNSLYVRPSDGAIFGVGDNAQFALGTPQVYWFSVNAAGVSSTLCPRRPQLGQRLGYLERKPRHKQKPSQFLGF